MTNSKTSRIAIVATLVAIVGCQQKMAEQPAPRPYEASSVFADNQSARPIERGTVHRNQLLDEDPLGTWLTPAGKKGRTGEFRSDGSASFDPNSIVKPIGAPDKVENFVSEFPMAITENDLKVGQRLFNAACAECHGGAGYANGKIVERGYLRPPSYHVDPAGKESDTGHFTGEAKKALPAGYSRGFDRWGVKVALKDVPVGYIYQVITWGYGGMPSHVAQLPKPEDRWRVVAYIRALQQSQSVPESELTPEMRAAVEGKKDDHKAEKH